MLPISLTGGLIYLFDERRNRVRDEEGSTQDAALRSRR